MSLKVPRFKIGYNAAQQQFLPNFDIYLCQINYHSRLGEPDIIDIVFMPASSILFKWQPRYKDFFEVEIFYENDSETTVLDCGLFECDRIEIRATNEIVIGGAQVPTAGSNIREPRTADYLQVSLGRILTNIAQNTGLQLVYSDNQVPDWMSFQKVSQDNISDLDLLKDLAGKLGLVVTFARGTMYIDTFKRLESLAPLNIRFNKRLYDSSSYVQGKIEDALQEVRYVWSEPKEERIEPSTPSIDNRPPRSQPVNPPSPQPEPKTFVEIVKSDYIFNGRFLVLKGDAENADQAKIMAQEVLRKSNSYAFEGTINFQGRPDLLSGFNVLLEDFYFLDGVYQIKQATHTLDFQSNGWRTTINVNRLERTFPIS